MNHDMGNIRENFKKWIKEAVPSNVVNAGFDEESIKGGMIPLKKL